jgi:tetratricopeptide (TPR) repeat protein
MPELRFSDVPVASGSGRRVEVTWRDGLESQLAVAEFGDGADARDGELVRWYLEDYAESPANPAPALATSAENLLAGEGTDLFRRLFSSPEAAGIWERARDRLGEVRVEVDTDPGDGPGLAWELLRDPSRDAALALGAGAFVRTHLRAAAHPDLPTPSGDRLRVLLVICRPGGPADVPFRSVAGRLLRGGAEHMEGLDLDVLRPATFARLSQVLHAAKAAGRPYHVVHFDGHGTYTDIATMSSDEAGLSSLLYGVSVAGPVRPGQHGYLLFEHPDTAQNQQLVDGPALGRLLVETGVPVLVLNACRSAYTEASSGPAVSGSRAREDELAGDVHARIRAYGSLAAEVADMGVPGVVAMRYNVYVVTAAQFVADLYAHLLAGRSLGEAATAARRGLAADPNRRIGAVSVALQDWAVPVVYESAPLVLLAPDKRAVPSIQITGAETSLYDPGKAGLPRPPDTGFFGRDETLLALDRAFDEQRTVLLHAFAGAGKSSTAAEFARWYQVTGGLDHPDRPEWSPGPVLWSSFAHHLTANRAIGMVGDHFSGLLEANEIAWAAVTDPARRRDIVLEVLAQVPVLWIWDNVEPVTGFPAGTPSAWTPAEQDELADLLRDLAQRTRCKVLVTSRRDERTWLGDLPALVRLPPMPIRESQQLATALAARRGRSLADADWRPLLRFAAGNPLTITVVTGQALRENLTTSEQVAGFVARLQSGDAQPEAGQDAALGRARSLAASLDYGFERAFTDAERARLALLHLFRDNVNVDILRIMGDSRLDDAVPELAGLDRGTGIELLDKAADIGLLSSRGDGCYHIHPALPWYFTALFTAAFGQPGEPTARRAARAYAMGIGGLGHFYFAQTQSGHEDQVIGQLRAEEANLLHGLDRSRAGGSPDAAIGCMQGLYALYSRTGREGELARLVADIAPDITDGDTNGPLPGREELWNIVTGYRVKLARESRDWPTATALQGALIARSRDSAAPVLSAPLWIYTPHERAVIRSLAVDLTGLGDILYMRDDPGCLPHYQEAFALVQRIHDRGAEARIAGLLGAAYLDVSGLLNLDQAEHWTRHSLDVSAQDDRYGRAARLRVLALIAEQRFKDARDRGEAKPVLLKHLNESLRGYLESLELVPPDDHRSRGATENEIGSIYRSMGDTGKALPHYQRSIHHNETRGDLYNAGVTRYNVALLLENERRISEALTYARAALDNFRHAGPDTADMAAKSRQLIAELEQRDPDDWHREGTALDNLGLTLVDLRRFEEAISAHREAAEIQREAGDRRGEGMALNNLGIALREMRRFEEAIAAHEEAAEIYRGAGDRRGEGMALDGLGDALRGGRRFEEAVGAHREAAAIFRETGDRHGEGAALNSLGIALHQMRRFEEAVGAHREAAEIYRETGDRHGEAMALTNLGIALVEMREFEEAISAHQQAAAIFRETGDRHREGRALNNLGIALQAVRRFDEAISVHQEDLAICRETGDRHGEGRELDNLGVALRQVRRVEEAIGAHQEAAEIYQETGDRHGVGRALTNLGFALYQVRRFEEAIIAHQEAVEIFRETGDRHAESIALDLLEKDRAASRT